MKPSTTRRYTLHRRAESQEATRRRIVQAAVDLHRTVGPARTTVSAIAARAGVQRHTVYRHFPDEPSLFRACTAHFLGQEPPPDTDSWATVEDFGARLRRGLAELYTYYQRNERMIANVLRDSEVLPVGAGFRTLQSKAATALLRRGRRRPGRRLMAVVAVATDFQTWRTLVRGGLGSEDAASAMAEMVSASR
jgi:AcrR family transcriptional regulator